MLRPAKPSEFDAIYTLLTASFPPDELRPADAQRALLNRPGFTAWVTDDLHAVITVWEFEDVAFIEHFAVSPALRGQGLGGKLLREMMDYLPLPLCLETELPDTPIAVRRLDFYRRSGFTVNPYPYVQPAYAPDRSSVPMCLLTTGRSISEAEFIHIRDTLYKEVYQVK